MSTLPSPRPARPDPHAAEVAAWLRARGLALPAWMLVETVRPVGWLLGQAALMAEPLARGLGWGAPLSRLLGWLDDPARLAALSDALSPDHEVP